MRAFSGDVKARWEARKDQTDADAVHRPRARTDVPNQQFLASTVRAVDGHNRRLAQRSKGGDGAAGAPPSRAARRACPRDAPRRHHRAARQWHRRCRVGVPRGADCGRRRLSPSTREIAGSARQFSRAAGAPLRHPCGRAAPASAPGHLLRMLASSMRGRSAAVCLVGSIRRPPTMLSQQMLVVGGQQAYAVLASVLQAASCMHAPSR